MSGGVFRRHFDFDRFLSMHFVGVDDLVRQHCISLFVVWLSDPESEAMINRLALGCPTKTCFSKKKMAQPAPQVFGGCFEGIQKDF